MNEPHLESRPGSGISISGQPRQIPGVQPPLTAAPTLIKNLPKPVLHAVEEAPLSLVEEHAPQPGAVAPQSRIHGFSDGGHRHYTENWKRQAHTTGTGAVRVRSFHGRLSEQGLEYMDHAINDWLDHHPEIEIKNVTSSVGLFDGKMKEPAVILNLWY
jgi:hypothetical protein